jgi:hypothetical protein
MALDGVHEGRRREGRALALAGAGGPSQRGRRPRWGLSRRKKPLAGSVGPLGQNGPMGRPTLLTPELRVDVERELADGVPVVVVAQRFGIGRRTLGRWISEGRVVRSRREPGPQTVHGVVNAQPAPIGASPDDPFDRAEPGLVAVVVDAARRGSWQAGAWLLERRWPERWARPPQRQIDDVLSGSAEDDAFAEVDRLAERRRRRQTYGPRIPRKGR